MSFVQPYTDAQLEEMRKRDVPAITVRPLYSEGSGSPPDFVEDKTGFGVARGAQQFPGGLTPTNFLPDRPATETEGAEAFGPDGYVGAAFRRENDVLNGLKFLSREKFAPDPDYNPSEDPEIIGTPFEQYLPNYVGSRSQAESRSITASIAQENKDADTIARGGIGGFLAAMGAGILSPTILIPIGGLLKTGGRAGQIAIRAAEGAALTAGAVAAQEGVLQATQETRTAEESFWRVGLAAGIGGVLGGVLGGIASRSRIGNLTTDEIDQIAAKAGDEIVGPSSVGAAASESARGSGELKGTFGAARVLRKLTPGLRTQTSEFTATRNTVRDLIKGDPLEENAEGIPSSLGGSVEAQVDIAHGPMGDVFEKYRGLYSDYVFGKSVPFPAAVRFLGRPFGVGANKLTYEEFRLAVSEAALNGDTHAIPQVAEAARYRRANLIDPLRDEAMHTIKGFKEMVEAETADQSYLTRIWNRTAVVARRDELRGILTRHFQSQQDALLNRVAELETKGTKVEKQVDAFSPQELENLSDEVIGHILGQSPGRIFTVGDFAVGVRGPLKERMLRTLPTTAVRDFVEKDIEAIDAAYTRTMASDISMTKKFGSVDMAEQIRKLNDEATAKGKGASEAEKIRIEKFRQRDERDLIAMRDIIRGTYKLPDNPEGLLHRSIAAGKTLNFLSSLGMMTVSSISDVGKPILVHGLTRVMRTSFQPLIFGLRSLKLAAKDAKLASVGTDMIRNDRVMSFAELVDDYGRNSKTERGLQQAGKAFSVLTLMAPWNAFFKQFTGIISQTRALQAIEALATGKAITKAEREFLASGGIDQNLAESIHGQFVKHGGKDGAVWYANTSKWTGKQATQALRALVNRDAERVIVSPGVGDKPLFAHGDLGSVIFQFQSFAVSSVQKTLLSGLAQRDMAVLNGVWVMLALGALSFKLKSDIAGRDLSNLSLAAWASEAVDNAGILGVLMNANHALEKVTDDHFGISSITGQPSRRYMNVNKMGSVLGPSFGKVSDLLDIVAGVTGGKVTASHTHKMRKMVPLQNLFWLRGGFDRMEQGINGAFGIPKTRQ